MKGGFVKPGLIVHVVAPHTGLPAAYGGNEPKEYVAMQTGEMLGFFNPCIQLKPGDNVVIVKAPRKVGGINLVRVRRGEIEGEVYWCELRASCSEGFKP